VENLEDKIYIFLNPDGTESIGLQVIVEFPTKVIYRHQCAGYACETREMEGFLVPLSLSAENFIRFFKRYDGHPLIEDGRNKLTTQDIKKLDVLVSSVVFWVTKADGLAEQRLNLLLNTEQIDEITEGWVPVKTPYGNGILVFDNCD
jgi:Family of unknown function (DUF6210)